LISSVNDRSPGHASAILLGAQGLFCWKGLGSAALAALFYPLPGPQQSAFRPGAIISSKSSIAVPPNRGFPKERESRRMILYRFASFFPQLHHILWLGADAPRASLLLFPPPSAYHAGRKGENL